MTPFYQQQVLVVPQVQYVAPAVVETPAVAVQAVQTILQPAVQTYVAPLVVQSYASFASVYPSFYGNSAFYGSGFRGNFRGGRGHR